MKITDWYNYSSSEKRWANIVTVTDRQIAYWVWIPRYKYKKTSNTEADIKFVDINDVYKDSNGANVPLGDDYVLPEAFEFNGVQLAGIWVNKYEFSNAP